MEIYVIRDYIRIGIYIYWIVFIGLFFFLFKVEDDWSFGDLMVCKEGD